MRHHTTTSKIKKFFNETIVSQLNNWMEKLIDGDLRSYEAELSNSLMIVYENISKQLLPIAAAEISGQLKEQGQTAGGRKIELRSMPVRIGTGLQVEVISPYVKKPGKDWVGSRHLLVNHWKIIGGATPALYDKVGYLAALGPSYEVGHQTLTKFGVNICQSSVRDLTNRLAAYCYDVGEENLMLEPQENLAGKNVVISVDGGRTRTRIYDGQVNESGSLTYQTAWCEPKLFVIDVLNETGQPERHELPVYGCRFAETDTLDLLKRYLQKLKINKANQVQILADGAPWIWKNVKPLLVSLDVRADRITETLDYYHASQYIHDLVDEMPNKIGQRQKKEYLTQFKDWLWEGATDQIVQACKKIYKRPGQLIKRWINYMDKHQGKTQYADYEANNLMCGSGIIESGIRRIINLRFKNSSTFWEKEKVEKLFFLRAALLSKRWELVMKNLSNIN